MARSPLSGPRLSPSTHSRDRTDNQQSHGRKLVGGHPPKEAAPDTAGTPAWDSPRQAHAGGDLPSARQTRFGLYPKKGLSDVVPRSVFTQEYERFRRLLIDARKRSGLSQAALAEKLSRPQSFVSKYERGERRLDVIETGLVARALGVDPIEFLRQVYKSKNGGST